MSTTMRHLSAAGALVILLIFAVFVGAERAEPERRTARDDLVAAPRAPSAPSARALQNARPEPPPKAPAPVASAHVAAHDAAPEPAPDPSANARLLAFAERRLTELVSEEASGPSSERAFRIHRLRERLAALRSEGP